MQRMSQAIDREGIQMIRTSLFIAALLSASIAYAGDATVTLSGQNGTVLVNSGKQFVSAHAGQTLAPGDRILVMKGGKATLTYSDGCVSTINSSSMVNVSAHCVQNSARTQKIAPMYAQAVGDTGDRHNCRWQDNSNNKDGCAGLPFWPTFAGWAVFVCVAIVCRDEDGHETIINNPPPISAP
jgi:hypothetical protein